MSLPYGLEHQDSPQLSPLTLHDWSADAVNGEMLAGVEEGLKALLKMQAKGHPKNSLTVPFPQNGPSASSSSQELVYGGKKQGRKTGSGSVVENGRSRGEFADTSTSSFYSSQSYAGKIGSGSSSSNHQRWRDEGKSAGSGGEDDSSDKTPTPPDDSSAEVDTPPPNTAPPPTNEAPPHRHNQHYPQPPFVTPLSTRTGHHLLHPDVLHQQFPHDISMLPVPHILCPSASGGSDGDSLSFAAVLGSDYTLDENVHMADIIALKYLDMPGSPSAKAAESTGETSHRNRGAYHEQPS